MNLILKYSLIYISGIFTGLFSPLIYIGIKNPKQLLYEFINN